MVYLRFNDPGSKKSIELKGSKAWDIVDKILRKIIPLANPQFDHLLSNVAVWKIEFDEEENATWREIGFDANGAMVVAMPHGKNYGYWTDNHLTLKDYDSFHPTVIDRTEFEKDWKAFVDQSGFSE